MIELPFPKFLPLCSLYPVSNLVSYIRHTCLSGTETRVLYLVCLVFLVSCRMVLCMFDASLRHGILVSAFVHFHISSNLGWCPSVIYHFYPQPVRLSHRFQEVVLNGCVREPRPSASVTDHRGVRGRAQAPNRDPHLITRSVRGGTQVPNRQSSFDRLMAEYTSSHTHTRLTRRAAARRRHHTDTLTASTPNIIQHSAEHVLRECPLVANHRETILGATSLHDLFHTIKGATKLATFPLASNSLLRPLPERPDPLEVYLFKESP